MKPFISVFLCLSCFAVGCDADGRREFDLVYKDHLIDAYVIPDKLTVCEPGFSQACRLSFSEQKRYSILSTDPDDLAEFYRLAVQHGDRLGRKILVYGGYIPGTIGCYVDDFVSVEVTSYQDWDKDHPAGSSLGDVFYLTFGTYAPIIRDGYRDVPPEQMETIYKPLDQLTPGDLEMMSLNPALSFSRNPPKTMPQTITVTFTTKSGRKLSAMQIIKLPS